jgi:hypothetical protein
VVVSVGGWVGVGCGIDTPLRERAQLNHVNGPHREREVRNEQRRLEVEEQERLGPQLAEHRAELEGRIRKMAIEHGIDPKHVKVLFKEVGGWVGGVGFGVD